MFYRIHSVNPLPNKHLLVCFWDNTVKQYNMEPLIRSIPAFQILEEPVLFNHVRVDAGGYGVTWNDNLDLSCNELWEKGEIVQYVLFILYISLKAIRRRIAFFFRRRHEWYIDAVLRSVWKSFLCENGQGAAGKGWKQWE